MTSTPTRLLEIGDKYVCQRCGAHYPAKRDTEQGRMPLPEALARGLARPVCNDCGGTWEVIR